MVTRLRSSFLGNEMVVSGEMEGRDGIGSLRQHLLTVEGAEGGIGVIAKFTLRYLDRRMSS